MNKKGTKDRGQDRTSELKTLMSEVRSLKRRLAKYAGLEKAYDESKARYQAVLDNIGKGVIVISPSMEILSLNRQARKWFPEIKPNERPLCYKSFNDPPGEAPCSYCPTGKTLVDGRVHQTVTETPAGREVRNYKITSIPAKDRGRQVVASVELVEDITGQTKLEKLIKKDRAMFLTILQKAPYGVALINGGGSYLFINKEFRKLTGYSLRDIPTGKEWFRKAYPDTAYRKRVIRVWKSDVTKRAVTRVFSVTCKDGRKKEIEFKPTLLRNGRSILMLSDVTKRKSAEESLKQTHELLEKRVAERTDELEKANKDLEQEILRRKGVEKDLREREEWLKAIIEAFDGLIYICSQDYRVEFMNERFIKRTGHDGKGERCYKAVHNRDSICPWCVNDRVFRGETVKWEVKSPKDNRWYYIVNTPIYHIDNSISKHSMMIDITERKETEAEIRKLNDELERKIGEAKEANRELQMFSYALSHDLKSPIIAVEGLSRRLVEKQKGRVDEKVFRTLKSLHKSGIQMRELVDGLLSFFSLGQKELNDLAVNMDSLVRDVFDQLKVVHEGKGIFLDLQTLPMARGDRIMIRQVLANILGNAVKYSSRGGPIFIRVGGERGTEENTYYVKDNGIGFSSEQSEKIFNAFKRLHPSDEYEGIGMGLAIVKRIVSRHGGSVWAESKPGEGSTFYFTLPSYK